MKINSEKLAQKIRKVLKREAAKPVMTIDQAIELLGLTPFDQFTPPPNAPDGRATGKTTRMLVEAVLRSQHEPVTIKAYTARYSRDLIRKAKSMAAQLGLDPDRIGDSGVPFIDHYSPNR